MQTIKKAAGAAAVAAAYLISAGTVFAQTITLFPEGGSGFANLGNLTISGIIFAFVNLLLVIAALIFFFMLVIGGIQWIVSGGDKAATEGARGRITAALIGLVIVFAAWAIINLIEAFFGVTILTLEVPRAGP